MIKLMTFFRAAEGVSVPRFASAWRDDYLRELSKLPIVRRHLRKAVHNFVTQDITVMYAHDKQTRTQKEQQPINWMGIGSYYFDEAAILQSLLVDPDFRALGGSGGGTMALTTHLLVREVPMFNKDPSHLPVKIMAFFKRKPYMSREEALRYYHEIHARVAVDLDRNKSRMIRYVQNHAIVGYSNPDKAFDYDGGPELWFASKDAIIALFSDAEFTDGVAEDEERFVIRSELAHFIIDEEAVVFTRDEDEGDA